MAKYLIRRETTEEIDLDPADLLTVSEAAKILGVTLAAVSNMVTSGYLTEIMDPLEPNPQRNRRVLHSEVEARLQRR